MNKKQRIEKLVYKFEQGLIDKNEFSELVDWYNSFDDTDIQINGDENIRLEDIKQRMFDRIIQQSGISAQSKSPKKRRIISIWKWSAAAAVLLIAGLWYTAPLQKIADKRTAVSIDQVIQPGQDKATLKLADGTTIELDAQSGGLISSDKITYEDGRGVLDPQSVNLYETNQILILETPKGGTYQLTLSDGTQVWLNAGSHLRYPAKFTTGEDRIVELQGEGYFKVSKQVDKEGKKVPFMVKTNRQQIEVLGTSFNVADYAHLAYTHTTLVEGKVAVAHQGKDFVLSPNQQWLHNKKSTLVKRVNPTSFIAWKDKKFDFENKSLEEVLDEISLWYDIQVEYQNAIPAVELVGDAYRNSDFNLILRLLQVAKVDYELDIPKRKLIIK